MSAEDRRVILLVYGRPGSGKSHLAEKLNSEHSYGLLSVDDAYATFIRTHCSMLYFEALDYYIGPHYLAILRDRPYAKSLFGRDLVAEWHEYLRIRIEGMSALHARLVVEGDLLRDCKDDFERYFGDRTRVYQIEVVNRSYQHHGTTLSLAEVAALE